MMLILALALLPFLLEPDDPAPGLRRTKAEARRLDCERLTVEASASRYPGQIDPAGPRGDLYDRDAVVCRELLARPGLRSPRDEAILSTLQDRALELARAAGSLDPGLEGRTWLVEAYYPDPAVAAKIAFATRNALAGQGLAVSDRAPTLAAGDVQVLTRMPPYEAYPAACTRYAANGSLGEKDALLAVIQLDARETILHAGLCSRGGWAWLR